MVHPDTSEAPEEGPPGRSCHRGRLCARDAALNAGGAGANQLSLFSPWLHFPLAESNWGPSLGAREMVVCTGETPGARAGQSRCRRAGWRADWEAGGESAALQALISLLATCLHFSLDTVASSHLALDCGPPLFLHRLLPVLFELNNPAGKC